VCVCVRACLRAYVHACLTLDKIEDCALVDRSISKNSGPDPMAPNRAREGQGQRREAVSPRQKERSWTIPSSNDRPTGGEGCSGGGGPRGDHKPG
jgi:hypothetical protein